MICKNLNVSCDQLQRRHFKRCTHLQKYVCLLALLLTSLVSLKYPHVESYLHMFPKDLHDLHDLMHNFSDLVYAQREKVETIQANVTEADEQVQHAVTHLARAAMLRRAFFPLTGALVGLTLGGPVGLVIGTKMALGCALGAGFLGYTGGKVLQRRAEQDETPVGMEIELQETSKRPSSHLDHF
ncbi:syntaxin 17 isoform X2 [Rhipicephalus microplus]|uniref:syntaxin 17 isoform X2 n=1 Tax=Rhipicephalus microplus TaxID=6941 RepID=UPI001888E0D3|nr:syntaxin-17-like isoform X2 [Rhipicephalus microplus]